VANDLGLRAIRWTPEGGGAFDCQRADIGVHLDLVVGWREVASVRGEDVTVPDRTGRQEGLRVKDKRDIELAGLVQGIGTVEATRLESYDDLVVTLQTAFDPTVRGVLEVDTRNGDTYSIRCLPLPLVWGPETLPGVSALSVALEAITPDWTLEP
jgi:hypothetical protein